MKPFRLYEPTTIDESVAVLRGLGEGGKLYAGGTELLLAMKVGLLSYDALVNIKRIDGLDGVATDHGSLTIGATATHTAIEHSPDVLRDFPLIARVEHNVANIRVRNVGTLVGNLCFAEPHSDPAALLLLYEASVEAVGPSGQRQIPIDELIAGPYETSLAEDEIVTRVRIPAFPTGMRGAYLKFGYHHRPTLGVGAAIRPNDGRIDDVRLSLGSVPSMPLRLRDSEAVLRGAAIDDESALAEAGRLAADSADAIDDIHGSADYKKHLVDVFLRRAVAQAIEEGVR
jgi:carbon-monoxide dehydrogenase medium subunit